MKTGRKVKTDREQKEDPGTSSTGSGALFIVATPIGNLEDVTFRAINALKSVNLVACEDTRTSRILLSKYGIDTPLISLHRFNENRKTRTILSHLEQGRSVALITDAGTPNISDPGYRLVRSAMEAQFRVVPIPGPSSVVAALSVSGIDGSSFSFSGFAPRKQAELIDFFENIRRETKTVVFLDTARRVVKTIDAARRAIPSRRMTLCRELTKKFEEILSGNPQYLYEKLEQRKNLRGEFVIVIEANDRNATPDIDAAIGLLIKEGMSGKSLAREAEFRFGISKTMAYRKFLSITKTDDHQSVNEITL